MATAPETTLPTSARQRQYEEKGRTAEPKPLERPAPPLVFTVIESEDGNVGWHNDADTLDDVIWEELESFKIGATDRTIFYGQSLVAVIRMGEDHQPQVFRYKPAAVRWTDRAPKRSEESKPAEAPSTALEPVDDDPPHPRDLMLSELRDAVAEYRRQRERANAGFADVRRTPQEEGDNENPLYERMERWASIVDEAAFDAERRLVAALLCAHGRIDRPQDLNGIGGHREGWRPCMFEIDKDFFVVAWDPCNEAPGLIVIDGAKEFDADWMSGDFMD